ncbi:hypothetical protein, partial [Paenibacillus sp. 598K]|uniref:hypothetical protein n=1 Tax=Paenibacillus sp. 598K TaxID=1117987 RepID=UPI001C867FD9
AAAAVALTGVAVGAVVYGAALLRCGAFGVDELRGLPGGAGLVGWLRRWRLLPSASAGAARSGAAPDEPM